MYPVFAILNQGTAQCATGSLIMSPSRSERHRDWIDHHHRNGAHSLSNNIPINVCEVHPSFMGNHVSCSSKVSFLNC